MASDAPPPATNNPVISSHPSTSGLKIALHPLALLSISDYITRHTLRQNTGPIVGALLGTQQGRDIAIEQAYEVKVAEGEGEENAMVGVEGEREVLVDEKWFDTRLKLCKSYTPPARCSCLNSSKLNKCNSQGYPSHYGPSRMVFHD